MDPSRFDRIARLAAAPAGRRGLLRALLAAVAGMAASGVAGRGRAAACLADGTSCSRKRSKAKSCRRCCSGLAERDGTGRARCICLADGAACESDAQCCARACVDGACGGGQTCPRPQIPCGGICVDASSDERNCGDCGVACAEGQTCESGQCGGDGGGCAPACAGVACGDDGCGGSCGTCPDGEACAGGACVPDGDDGNDGGGGGGGGGGAPRSAALGTNLAAVVDWATQRPFADAFKSARPWFSGTAATFDDGRPLDLDADGNLRSLLPGQMARSVVFTAVPADPGLSGAVFEVRWAGTGTVDYGNVTVLSRAPGLDTIRLATASGPDANLTVIVTVSAVDPADPIRDLRMTPPGGICRSDPFTAAAGPGDCAGDYSSFAGDPERARFSPQFLSNLRAFGSLRFMDWARTNESTLATWADRPLPRHQFWSTERGVPVEVMADLCNALGADAWFTIPHLMTDAAIRSWGELAGQRLASGRAVWVEWSNEVWNGIFPQTQYALEQADRLNLDPDRYTGMAKFYAQRASEAHAAFVAGFGDASRVRRVAATQAVVPYFTETILAHLRSLGRAVDVFAIAPYFGQTVADAGEAAEFVRLGVDGTFAWLRNGGNPRIAYGSLPEIRQTIAAQVAAAGAFGVPLAAYEGGQHFVAVGAGGGDAQLEAVFDAVNRDPRMRDVYLDYLRDWRAQTGQPFHHFTDVELWTAYGRWGAKQYPGQSRAGMPKFDALLAFAEETA